jgi:hypothetical protein
MRKITTLFIIAVVMTGLCSSAFALAPMGPPKARLDLQQWSLGLEYENSKMDFETSKDYRVETIDGSVVPTSGPKSKYKIEDFKTNTVYVNAGYGITGDWDYYMQFGVSDASADITEIEAGIVGDQYKGFDSSFGFSWGLGTRATFAKDGDLSWGGLLQANYAKPDSSDLTCLGDEYFRGNAQIEYWDIQLAAGPTFESEYLRIYGGPFLHLLYGQVDLDGTAVYPDPDPATITVTSSMDIEMKVEAGAYAGAQFYLDENCSLYTECQFTSDAFGIGVGITWRY